MIQENFNTLKSEQAQMEEAELKLLAETLQSGFAKIASAKGVKNLADLSSEYEQLKNSLSQRSKKCRPDDSPENRR